MADMETKEPDIKDQNFSCQIPGFEEGKYTVEAVFSFIRGMLNSMTNPVVYTDKNGVIFGVNNAFSRQIAGLPEEKIIGHKIAEMAGSALEEFFKMFPENSHQSMLRCFEEWDKTDRQLLKFQGNLTLECEGVCADGIKRSFLLNKSVFNSWKGEISGLITVMQDISEIRQIEKDLRKNLEFKKKLLDEIPVPVFYKNTEGRYTGCNKLFAKEIIGLPEEEITGKLYGELTYQAPEDLIKNTMKQIFRYTGKE